MVTVDSVDRINLVLNGGFELGTDGWDITPGVGGLTGTDATEGADAGSGHCLALSYTVADGADPGADPGTVSQTLDPALAAHLRGRQLSFQIRVAANGANVLVPFISTDGGETKTYGGGNGGSWGHGWPGPREELEAMYETLKMEGVVLADSDDLTGIVFGIEVRQTCEAKLDNASLVFGSASVAASSCIPAGVLGYLSGAVPSGTPTRAAAPRERSETPPEKPPEKPPERSAGSGPSSRSR